MLHFGIRSPLHHFFPLIFSQKILLSSAFLCFQVLPSQISQPLQSVPGSLDAVALGEVLGIAGGPRRSIARSASRLNPASSSFCSSNAVRRLNSRHSEDRVIFSCIMHSVSISCRIAVLSRPSWTIMSKWCAGNFNVTSQHLQLRHFQMSKGILFLVLLNDVHIRCKAEICLAPFYHFQCFFNYHVGAT